jgi:Mg2+-importing ATPase
MAVASLFLPFLPLLARQILLNNLLSDIPSFAIAGDNVDRDLVRAPGNWNIGYVKRFMLTFGLVSSLFDAVTFLFLLIVAEAGADLFRTGWFVESLMTELAIVMVVRTHKPFYMSRPAPLLVWSTVAVAALTLAIPYLPFADRFAFVPLPTDVMAGLLLITALYLMASEVAKRYFFRRELPRATRERNRP